MRQRAAVIIMLLLSACERTDRNEPPAGELPPPDPVTELNKPAPPDKAPLPASEPALRGGARGKPIRPKISSRHFKVCRIDGEAYGRVPRRICEIARERRVTSCMPTEVTDELQKKLDDLADWLETTDLTAEEINRLFPYSYSTLDWGLLDVAIEFDVCYQWVLDQPAPEGCVECELYSHIGVFRDKKTGVVRQDGYSE